MGATPSNLLSTGQTPQNMLGMGQTPQSLLGGGGASSSRGPASVAGPGGPVYAPVASPAPPSPAMLGSQQPSTTDIIPQLQNIVRYSVARCSLPECLIIAAPSTWVSSWT